MKTLWLACEKNLSLLHPLSVVTARGICFSFDLNDPRGLTLEIFWLATKMIHHFIAVATLCGHLHTRVLGH